MKELVFESYPLIRKGEISAWSQDLSLGFFHCASELEVASLIDLDQPTTARQLLNQL